MDIQETVDAIQGFMCAGDRSRVDLMIERSAEYAQACEQANARLRKCNDALRRNLRGDAIQIAETEPNLLDLVALLDFSTLSEWKEVCGLTTELTEPPDLLIEVAAAVNEAYAAEQPLQSLMASHRVLALARAPLTDRLRVMRRLSELDVGSGFWEDDVRTFETARLDQMRGELNVAIKANDAAGVARLNEELSHGPWRAPVPHELRRNLEGATARLTAARSVAELRMILPKLNEAYGAMSYAECKGLLGQWLATIAATKLTVPPDLQEQVDPILSWVREEDHRRQQQSAFDEACAALEQAIDTDQPTPMLETAYERTLKFHIDLPEALEVRYRQRLVMRAAAAKHRRRMVYVGVAASFVLIAGLAIWLAYQSVLSREISDAGKTLDVALADVQAGEIDKGQTLRRELMDGHPRILHSPQITKELADLENAVAAEQQRAADFQKHLQAAVAAGLTNTDDSELQQAVALKKTPAEDAELADFQTKLKGSRLQSQQQADQQFTADGQQITQLIEDRLTEELMTSNPDGYAAQAKGLSQQVESLRQRTGVTASLKEAQLAALDAVLARKERDLSQQQSGQKILASLRNFGSTPEAHAAALKQFIATCPGDPRCDSFQRAIDQLPAEQAVAAWSDLVKGWTSSMVPANYAAAQQRSAQVKQYLDKYPTSPLAESVQAYKAYLDTGLQMAAPDGPWKAKLRILLKNPLISGLKMFETVKGERYYVLPNVDIRPVQLNGAVVGQSFDAITTPDVTKTNVVSLNKNELLKTIKPMRSPQAVFADEATSQIDGLDFNDWDVCGLNILRLLSNRTDISPVLRGILMQHILQLNQPTAVFEGQVAFGKVADALVEQNVEDMEWLDPKHQVDSDALDKLQATFGQLPQLPAAKTQALDRRKMLLTTVNFSAQNLAIVLKNGSQSEIISSEPATTGQQAVIISSDNKVMPIGSFTGNGWSLDASHESALSDGALVFVLTPPR